MYVTSLFVSAILAVSSAAIPASKKEKPEIVVKVIVKTTGAYTVYDYRIKNKSDTTINIFKLGLDSSTPPNYVDELKVSQDKAAFESPAGWSGQAVVPEESSTFYMKWIANGIDSVVVPSGKVKGFKIRVKTPDTAYTTCHFEARDTQGRGYVGVVKIIQASDTDDLAEP